MKEKKKKVYPYLITLRGSGQVLEEKCETPYEGIQKLKPDVLKSTFVISVRKGDNYFEKLMPLMLVKRMLVSDFYRQVLGKMLKNAV